MLIKAAQKSNNINRAKFTLLGFITACMLGSSLSAAGLYRWVDENGAVHFGDSIPAKYSKVKRQRLNRQGIVIDTMAAEKTKEELAAEALERARLAKLKKEAAIKAERNRILLSSYINTNEIENTRDQKIQTVKKQIELLELNYNNLEQQKTVILQRIGTFEDSNEIDKEEIIERFKTQLESTNKNLSELDIERANLNVQIVDLGKFYAQEKQDYIRLIKEREKQRKAENHPLY